MLKPVIGWFYSFKVLRRIAFLGEILLLFSHFKLVDFIMKMKSSVLILLVLLSFQTVAETVYIDDKIKIWSRTGESNDYRVKYQYAPGTKLEVIQKNEESGFVEVRDETGRTGWLDSKFITSEPTAHQLLVNANKQITSLTQSHLEKISVLEKRVIDLAPLESFNQELQNKLARQETELEQLRQKSEVYKGGFYSEVFFMGAVVVLSGMLLGWLLSKLGGRRRNTGWN